MTTPAPPPTPTGAMPAWAYLALGLGNIALGVYLLWELV